MLRPPQALRLIQGASGGPSRTPNSCLSALSAACQPAMPCTPGPGVVDAEHR